MYELISAATFGFMILAFVLGVTCIVMGATTGKQGPEALKERVEYGFMGVSGLVIALLTFFGRL